MKIYAIIRTYEDYNGYNSEWMQCGIDECIDMGWFFETRKQAEDCLAKIEATPRYEHEKGDTYQIQEIETR